MSLRTAILGLVTRTRAEGLIGHNDPDYQEKVVKFNELIANCVMYSTACDITDAANAIAAEGEPVDPADLATISLYITSTIRRSGNWTLNLTPPEQAPVTRLDLEPRVLFAPRPGAQAGARRPPRRRRAGQVGRRCRGVPGASRPPCPAGRAQGFGGRPPGAPAPAGR
jgi:hypothetical protein